MATTVTEKQVIDLLGAPVEIDKEIQDLHKSARILSSQRQRLIEKYPQKWVALYQGAIGASAPTYSQLLSRIDRENISRSSVIVRFISKNIKTMIL